MERNQYYWALIGILGLVVDSSHSLELTPSSIRFPNGEEITGSYKEPLVIDGDGNILGRVLGVGYSPGSNQVDVMTDKGYILKVYSSGELGSVDAYGGKIVYRDASCEIEEWIINATSDTQSPPPIVKLTQGVYQNRSGDPVYIRGDAAPRSLVYYAFRLNNSTGIMECQLITDDLTLFYSNWYGVGGPDPQIIDILPNDPSVTGFPGVAGKNYPLKTPIEVVYW